MQILAPLAGTCVPSRCFGLSLYKRLFLDPLCCRKRERLSGASAPHRRGIAFISSQSFREWQGLLDAAAQEESGSHHC